MNLEISTALTKDNMLIEYWRIEYNQVLSQKASDYFPHSPEAITLKILT